MSKAPTIFRKSASYSTLPILTSKQARENLPVLVDDVVDSGIPIVITKLRQPRAALIPARWLPLYDLVEYFGMDITNVANRSIDNLVVELGAHCERHLGFEPKIRELAKGIKSQQPNSAPSV